MRKANSLILMKSRLTFTRSTCLIKLLPRTCSRLDQFQSWMLRLPCPEIIALLTPLSTSFHKQTCPPSRETRSCFWERFSQRISVFPGIAAADKIVQLERAIKPPDGRALILAAKGTEEEYVASVKALQKRYDQPRRIYRAYVQDTFGHLTPRTRKGINELITHAQESMTALRLYGGMDAGSVMVAIYEKGLDKETTKEWSAYTSRKKLQPTMEHFKEFLTQQQKSWSRRSCPT